MIDGVYSLEKNHSLLANGQLCIYGGGGYAAAFPL